MCLLVRAIGLDVGPDQRLWQDQQMPKIQKTVPDILSIIFILIIKSLKSGVEIIYHAENFELPHFCYLLTKLWCRVYGILQDQNKHRRYEQKLYLLRQ